MRYGLELPPHIRVFAAFFIYSFCLGSLYPRLPAIQTAMGVGEGGLGLALVGSAIGTLISLTFATPILDKVGYRRSLLVLVPVLSLLFAVAVLASGPLQFFLLLLPVGMCIGAIELIINLEADRTEALLGRRIMNRAHAFWSFGFFSAGLAGAVIAQLGISPAAHLFGMVPVVLLATILFLGKYNPAKHRVAPGPEKQPLFARPSLAIMVLVAVTLSAMVLEGAGADWSAIYMRNVFSVEPFIAGLAVATGAGAQALARFFADGFVERFSPVLVARTLLSVLGIGTLIVFFSPFPMLSLLGFALMGVGTSAIFPLAMSAAAQRTDRPAAINVAALAQISFVAFLLGPPLLGLVAEHFGIRWSFGVGIPLVILSLVTAQALGQKPMAEAAPAEQKAPGV
ncbi:MFS transporter [Devosia pacifica]|uniref:MFS transporter n=1 Tax=Devosia pacifica TaxID=1335967 RepID=A0A918S4I2_9HYPH|nr:MFS transporter [Devosia pacifica]GHA22723.1 MFS transporter [Devosia pacifica]